MFTTLPLTLLITALPVLIFPKLVAEFAAPAVFNVGTDAFCNVTVPTLFVTLHVDTVNVPLYVVGVMPLTMILLPVAYGVAGIVEPVCATNVNVTIC